MFHTSIVTQSNDPLKTKNTIIFIDGIGVANHIFKLKPVKASARESTKKGRKKKGLYKRAKVVI